jgi:hypothetical protein
VGYGGCSVGVALGASLVAEGSSLGVGSGSGAAEEEGVPPMGGSSIGTPFAAQVLVMVAATSVIITVG